MQRQRFLTLKTLKDTMKKHDFEVSGSKEFFATFAALRETTS